MILRCKLRWILESALVLSLSLWFTGQADLACATDTTKSASGRPYVVHLDLARQHGPYFIMKEIEEGRVFDPEDCRRSLARNRWAIAIDAAKNAQRLVPILPIIEGKTTALLVVDMQRAFLDTGAAIEVPEGRLILDNINRIASAVRQKGGTVVLLRYLVSEDVGMLRFFENKSYLGNGRESPLKALQRNHPQFELYPGLDVRGSDIVMDKTRYSAVLGSKIVDVLRANAIRSVIVTGVTTDVCAGNTAEDLMQMDFHVVVVWDGTAALDRLEHELYLARIFGLYGDVMPTEEVLMRLK